MSLSCDHKIVILYECKVKKQYLICIEYISILTCLLPYVIIPPALEFQPRGGHKSIYTVVMSMCRKSNILVHSGYIIQVTAS